MSHGRLINLVETPQCAAVMLEPWNAAPGRFYVGYRRRGAFRMLLGQGVVDEFHTISAPVLIAPAALLGEVYDTGMRLADLRDVEAPIDQGWPPLTIGIEGVSVDAGGGWQDDLLAALQAGRGPAQGPWRTDLKQSKAAEYGIEVCRVVVGDVRASVIVTDAPLLPEQLERVAEHDDAPISVAVATGNRLPRVEAGALHRVDVVSEQQLAALCRALPAMPPAY